MSWNREAIFAKLKRIKDRKWMFVFATLFVCIMALSPNIVFAISGPFMTLLGFATAMLNIVVYAIGQVIILVLSTLVIPVLGYDNFGDSVVVSIGWPLVRDVVNMFVIVVLVVIAVQTIIGYSKAEWEKQLPRFFIAIVLVNFSKTICLIMIDVSQVIMMTFVNALRDIAAGNFVTLLQIDEFISLHSQAGGGSYFEHINLFATAFVSLALLGAVLGTILILLIVFLYRIVILWVLLILSPIAFFLGGIEHLFSDAAGKYKEWWGMFSGALTIGPLMTFFLWLALAVASSGQIAVVEGMNFASSGEGGGLLSGIFDSPSFTSLMLALVLILAGFKVSSSAANSIGGFAGKLLNENTGKRLVKNSFAWPAKGAYKTGRGMYRGGRYVAGKAGQQIARTNLGESMGSTIMLRGENLARSGGFFGRMAGNTLISAGAKIHKTSADSKKQAMDVARQGVENMSDEKIMARMSSIVDSDGRVASRALNSEGTEELAMLQKLTYDSKFARKYRERDPQMYEQLMTASLAHSQENFDNLSDDEQKSVRNARNKNLNLWHQARRLNDPAHNEAAEIAENLSIMSEEDFKPSQFTNPADIVNPNFVQAARQKNWGKNTDGSDRTVMNVLKHGGKGIRQDVQQAAATGSATGAVELSRASSQQIAEAVRSGMLRANTIQATDMSDPARAQAIAKGLLDAKVNMQTVDDTAKPALRSALADLRNSETSVGKQREIDVARIAAGEDARTVVNVQAGGSLNARSSATLKEAVKQNPEISVNFQNEINTALSSDSFNDVTRVLSENMDPGSIQKMLQRFNEAQTSAQRDQIREALEQHRSALLAEGFRPEAERSISDSAMRDLARRSDLALREMRNT